MKNYFFLYNEIILKLIWINMLKVLDKTRKYVIVKMDIQTFSKIEKKPTIQELIDNAMNSEKTYYTHEELMADLMS